MLRCNSKIQKDKVTLNHAYFTWGARGILLSKAQEIEACNREKVKFHGLVRISQKNI